MKILNINNLTKMYNETSGIKDISFSLEEKEAIAILGKSGSGKSTLLKTILNISLPNSGKVSIFNTSLRDNYVDLMRVIGYTPDTSYTFPKTTIKAFVKTINTYYNQDYTKDIFYYLDLFKLNPELKLSYLSSGEAQKLSLILALFHKPKLLILDEPTNFLDTSSIHILTKVLKGLKYEGTSIIIASHSLNFILELADKIYLLTNNSLIDVKDKIKKNDYKKITLSLTKDITYKDLNIKGITNISIKENIATFIFIGDISYLLKKLASFDISDIAIENPTTEDIIGGLLDDLS